MLKNHIKSFVPSSLWKRLRLRRIVGHHAQVVRICENLIEDYYSRPADPLPAAKKDLGTDKIIWQYWAQGFDGELPEVIQQCLASADKYASDYQIIRLDNNTISDYLDLPQYVIDKCGKYSMAHFSDLLRVLLLSAYGGVWLDTTVLLSAPLPEEYKKCNFFMFQRDKDERNKKYWENTYAYYFGWHKNFHVNVLNSIVFAKKDNIVINALAGLLLKWWEKHDAVPDYFFFQILFDVLINGRMKGYNCPIVSDCKPHYLQQSINDPDFSLMDKDKILPSFPIHKLTYKKEK